MALNSITKKSNQGRDIKYLNKDFSQYRQNLIEYAKTYFPQTYTDFNESSPGMMFIEMASYIGDVLSYYLDDSLKESLMLYAEDKQNVLALSQFLGYKPKVTSPAIVKLSVYQLVPSRRKVTSTGSDFEPDPRFFLRIQEGMVVESTENGVPFRTTEVCDFTVEDDREISVYQTNSQGEPDTYLVKKYVNAISGQLRTVSQTFGTSQQFSQINLGDTNVIDIVDVHQIFKNQYTKRRTYYRKKDYKIHSYLNLNDYLEDKYSIQEKKITKKLEKKPKCLINIPDNAS